MSEFKETSAIFVVDLSWISELSRFKSIFSSSGSELYTTVGYN
jgi:hypothetical protein